MTFRECLLAAFLAARAAAHLAQQDGVLERLSSRLALRKAFAVLGLATAQRERPRATLTLNRAVPAASIGERKRHPARTAGALDNRRAVSYSGAIAHLPVVRNRRKMVYFAVSKVDITCIIGTIRFTEQIERPRLRTGPHITQPSQSGRCSRPGRWSAAQSEMRDPATVYDFL